MNPDSFTMIPNDLIDRLLPAMSEAELKIALALIRQTVGWGRETWDGDTSSLMKLTGLSRTSCLKGVEETRNRGIFECEGRVNVAYSYRGVQNLDVSLLPTDLKSGSVTPAEGTNTPTACSNQDIQNLDGLLQPKRPDFGWASFINLKERGEMQNAPPQEENPQPPPLFSEQDDKTFSDLSDLCFTKKRPGSFDETNQLYALAPHLGKLLPGDLLPAFVSWHLANHPKRPSPSELHERVGLFLQDRQSLSPGLAAKWKKLSGDPLMTALRRLTHRDRSEPSEADRRHLVAVHAEFGKRGFPLGGFPDVKRDMLAEFCDWAAGVRFPHGNPYPSQLDGALSDWLSEELPKWTQLDRQNRHYRKGVERSKAEAEAANRREEENRPQVEARLARLRAEREEKRRVEDRKSYEEQRDRLIGLGATEDHVRTWLPDLKPLSIDQWTALYRPLVIEHAKRTYSLEGPPLSPRGAESEANTSAHK